MGLQVANDLEKKKKARRGEVKVGEDPHRLGCHWEGAPATTPLRAPKPSRAPLPRVLRVLDRAFRAILVINLNEADASLFLTCFGPQGSVCDFPPAATGEELENVRAAWRPRWIPAQEQRPLQQESLQS